MKDFNNIEADPIPEGLEFNESYMHDAFALYDAEKSKRKRRLLIWWITSALGFSCVLLLGIFFFSQGEKSGDPEKKAPSGKELFVQRFSTGSDSAITNKVHSDKVQNQQMQATSGTAQTRVTTSNLKLRYSKNLRSTKTDRQLNTRSSFKKNRITKSITGKGIPERTSKNEQSPTDLPFANDATPENTVRHETDEIVDSEVSKPAIIESIDLPLKPAVLAFVDDSASQLPAWEEQKPLLATESNTRKHNVFLNLGVNTLFGMKELKNKATFRESIGVSYKYQLNPKLAIGAGLEYHSISRISYKRKIGDTTNSDKTTTILNKTTLNYISFSPQIHYQFLPNHTLNAGFGIEYLLVDPGERYEIDNYTQETPKRTNSKLYYSTFNRFNFSASLGYTYQFSRFMAVHASYYYGFTDITINTDFNKTFDRNSRLQIGLKIKLY